MKRLAIILVEILLAVFLVFPLFLKMDSGSSVGLNFLLPYLIFILFFALFGFLNRYLVRTGRWPSLKAFGLSGIVYLSASFLLVAMPELLLGGRDLDVPIILIMILPVFSLLGAGAGIFIASFAYPYPSKFEQQNEFPI